MKGFEIYDFAKELWPINRSITGEGVRATLDLINSICLT
jgi:aminopeptidase-like protein